MAIAKLKIGDHVQVIAGSSKGSVGRVLRIENDRIWVEGVKMVKKSLRLSPEDRQEGKPGHRLQESSIHRSNVVLYDQSRLQRVKVAIQEIEGKRVRVDRKTGEALETGAALAKRNEVTYE